MTRVYITLAILLSVDISYERISCIGVNILSSFKCS